MTDCCFEIHKEMYGNIARVVLLRTIARQIYKYVQNKRNLTSVVVFCRPCCSKPRIFSDLKGFACERILVLTNRIADFLTAIGCAYPCEALAEPILGGFP